MSLMVCEVGPRDGLQNEERSLEPALRAELANRLAQAGLKRIEAVSFVSPKTVPHMSGAEEVVDCLVTRAGTSFAGLILNERGLERLVKSGLVEAHFAFGVTDSFNMRNQNATVEQSLQAAECLIKRSKDNAIYLTTILAVAFGCPFEGVVDQVRVIDIAHRLIDMGADEVCFADTIGVGAPRQVRAVISKTSNRAVPIGVHLHDTRGLGLVNAYAAIEGGATIIDSSVGGLGGCPFAPGATGNISTEDLVYMLEGLGISTSIDLHELNVIARWLGTLLDKELPGHAHKVKSWPFAK